MGGYAVYGLGILLTVQDQATGKLTGINSTLQKVSQTAMSMTYMGKSLMNIGSKMLSPIVGLGKEVIRVNADAEKTRITLGALYEDAAKGNQKLQEVYKYAATTPFEIEELKAAATTFKTLGVEILGAGSDVTSTFGTTRQFMDVLGDLGAGLSGVARNGFKDVTYAVKEFVTEGNKLSFLRRLGIDIDTVLTQAGKTVGDDIQSRLVNMADIAKILHFEGLTDKMFGTWSQVISNMSDIWDLFLLQIGDTEIGLFEEDKFGNTVFGGFKRTLDKVSQLIHSISFDGFAQSIGKAMYSIMQPLDKLGSKIVDVFQSVVRAITSNPAIAKLAVILPMITGGLLWIAGAGLVAKGAVMMFGWGLKIVVGMLPKLLIFVGIFALVKRAWDKDIGGLRTRLTGFSNSISKAFNDSKRISEQSVGRMILDYRRLKSEYADTKDIGTNLTIRLLQMTAIWKSLCDVWNDNKLSNENYRMLEQMGLLPIFNDIVLWKNRIMDFFDGFTEGVMGVVDAIGKLCGKLVELFPFLNELEKKMNDTTESKGFKNWGKFIGTILTISLTLRSLFSIFGSLHKTIISIGNLFKGAWKVIKWVLLPFKGAGKLIMSTGGALARFFGDLGAAIALVKEGNSVWAVLGVWFPKLAKFVGGIAEVFSVVGSALATFGGWIWSGIQWIIDGIMAGLGAIAAALGIPVWAAALVVVAIIALVTAVVVFWDKIVASCKKTWSIVCDLWGKFSSWAYENIITPVANFFEGLWNRISEWAVNTWNNVSNTWNSFKDKVNTQLIQPIKNAFLNCIYFIVGLAAFAWEGIKWAWGKIAPYVDRYVVKPITKLWNKIVEVATSVWNAVVTKVTDVWNTFVNILIQIPTWIDTNIIQPITNFFKQLWDNIVRIATDIWNSIVNIWNQISDWVYQHVILPIINFLRFLWDNISSVIVNIWNTICNIWGAIARWVDANLIQPIKNRFSGLWGNVKSGVSTVKSSITGAFQSAYSSVTAIWSGITSFFENIWIKVSGLATKIINKGKEVLGIKIDAGHNAQGTNYWRGGLSFINEEGGELVDLPQGSRVYPHDESVQMAYDDGFKAAIGGNKYESSSDNRSYDNSITFAAGSIVIQANGASETEAERLANLVIQKIEQKARRKRLATYAI